MRRFFSRADLGPANDPIAAKRPGNCENPRATLKRTGICGQGKTQIINFEFQCNHNFKMDKRNAKENRSMIYVAENRKNDIRKRN